MMIIVLELLLVSLKLLPSEGDLEELLLLKLVERRRIACIWRRSFF